MLLCDATHFIGNLFLGLPMDLPTMFFRLGKHLSDVFAPELRRTVDAVITA